MSSSIIVHNITCSFILNVLPQCDTSLTIRLCQCHSFMVDISCASALIHSKTYINQIIEAFSDVFLYKIISFLRDSELFELYKMKTIDEVNKRTEELEIEIEKQPTNSYAPKSNENNVLSKRIEKKNEIEKKEEEEIEKQIKAHPNDYVIGEFSLFAKRIDTEVKAKDKIIDQVIKEAILSYEKALTDNMKYLNSMMNSDDDIFKEFEDENMLKEYIRRPESYYFRKYSKKEEWTFSELIKEMHVKETMLKNTAEVDGKFLQLKNIIIKKRLYDSKHLYLATTSKDLYIKLSSVTKPVKVILKEGRFMDHHTILKEHEDIKKEIFEMVSLFLEKKGILFEKSSISEEIKLLIEKNIKL